MAAAPQLHAFLEEWLNDRQKSYPSGTDFIHKYQKITGQTLNPHSTLPRLYLQNLVKSGYFQQDHTFIMEDIPSAAPNGQAQPGGLLSTLIATAKKTASKYLFPPPIPDQAFLDKYSLEEDLLKPYGQQTLLDLGVDESLFSLQHLPLAAVLAAPHLFSQHLRSGEHLLNADLSPSQPNSGYLASLDTHGILTISRTCYYGERLHQISWNTACPELSHQSGIIGLIVSEKGAFPPLDCLA